MVLMELKFQQVHLGREFPMQLVWQWGRNIWQLLSISLVSNYLTILRIVFWVTVVSKVIINLIKEGVQAEAVALAGHLKLGRLIALYDDNHISIDGDTALGFTEDVCKRFESYGWHTLVVSDGDCDLAGIESAIEKAKSVTDKPTLIKIRFKAANSGQR
jgi:hypothetical protein